jgi:hypothetical protein
MPFTPLHDSLYDHWKVEDLEDQLEVEKFQAIGLLACLWLWAMRYAPDGDLSKIRPSILARKAGWKGDAQGFIEALVRCGWLEQTPDGRLVIHDWDDYAGQYFRAREAANRRQAEYRARKVSQRDDRQASVTPVSRDGDIPINSASRDASVTVTSASPSHHVTSLHDMRSHDTTGHDALSSDAPDARPAASALGTAGDEPSKSPRKKKGPEDFPPVVDDLVTLLADKVEQHSGVAPRLKEEWWVEMDRLIRLDRANAQEVQETIIWVFRDDFWPGVIINAWKLRKNYQQLRAKMAAERQSNKVVQHPAAAGSPPSARRQGVNLSTEEQDAEIAKFLSLFGAQTANGEGQ